MDDSRWVRRPLSVPEAAAYILDPRNERGFHVMAANYDSEGEEGEWDGLTSEDLVIAADGRDVDLDLLAEFGPLELWFAGPDPGAPRPFTSDEALAVISARLTLLGDGANLRTRSALNTLESAISGRSDPDFDPEWGSPGTVPTE